MLVRTFGVGLVFGVLAVVAGCVTRSDDAASDVQASTATVYVDVLPAELRPTNYVVSGAEVFWIGGPDTGDGRLGVYARALDGSSAPRLLAEGKLASSAFAVDAENVYFVDAPSPQNGYTIMSVPRVGGAPSTLTYRHVNFTHGDVHLAAPDGIESLLVDEGNVFGEYLIACPRHAGPALAYTNVKIPLNHNTWWTDSRYVYVWDFHKITATALADLQAAPTVLIDESTIQGLGMMAVGTLPGSGVIARGGIFQPGPSTGGPWTRAVVTSRNGQPNVETELPLAEEAPPSAGPVVCYDQKDPIFDNDKKSVVCTTEGSNQPFVAVRSEQNVSRPQLVGSTLYFQVGTAGAFKVQAKQL